MSIFDPVRNWLMSWLLRDAGPEYTTYRNRVELMRDYREGRQRNQIKIKPLQPDDNLFINFCSLIADRTVSLLFGDGIGFDLGESKTEQEYIDAVMDANKQEILFHKLGMMATESGDCYVKILPDALEVDGATYPRLIAIDPLWVELETDPQDFETIRAYNIRYTVVEGNKTVAYWERTQHKNAPIVIDRGVVYSPEADIDMTQWEVVLMKSNDNSGKYEMVGEPTEWDYTFPPICHWQNLPSPCSAYGQADITEDVVRLQDAINFIASDEKKINRLHAHPKTIAKNVTFNKLDVSPDQIIQFTGDANADIKNLEMQSDLAGSNNFLLFLRQCLFDITRTVDITSMADKLGALTNFGLRVLYADALFKLGTKRELYGDGIEELVHRLLELNGMKADCEIVWPDMLPVNDTEVINAQARELELGLVSKETVAAERGRDWEKEQALMATQAVNEGNIGEQIMAAFDRGQL